MPAGDKSPTPTRNRADKQQICDPTVDQNPFPHWNRSTTRLVVVPQHSYGARIPGARPIDHSIDMKGTITRKGPRSSRQTTPHSFATASASSPRVRCYGGESSRIDPTTQRTIERTPAAVGAHAITRRGTYHLGSFSKAIISLGRAVSAPCFFDPFFEPLCPTLCHPTLCHPTLCLPTLCHLNARTP